MSSDDCEVIICSGNAKPTDSHLAASFIASTTRSLNFSTDESDASLTD
jgi:hypothetical protein